MAPQAAQPVFYYDLASPACYLVGERIMSELPVAPEWEPVLVSAAGAGAEGPDREQIERLAREGELQPFRWPPHWPPDTRRAMLAATYAKRVGRAVAFSLAAFRQAFAAGRDLGQQSTLLIAAAAAEMHPTAVLKGLELRSTRQALAEAVQRARATGVQQVPAVALNGVLYEGERQIERAAAALHEAKGTENAT